MRRLLIPLAALALVAAACGTNEAEGDDDTAALPPAASACEEGTLDCNDTPDSTPDDLFYGDEPRGEEPGEDETVNGIGMPVQGGLSVSDALTTEATGILAVTGFYFDDGSGPRLCELLLESYPAQCGGAVLPMGDGGVDPESLDSAQGVTWSPNAITVLGEIVDGVLQPTPTSI